MWRNLMRNGVYYRNVKKNTLVASHMLPLGQRNAHGVSTVAGSTLCVYGPNSFEPGEAQTSLGDRWFGSKNPSLAQLWDIKHFNPIAGRLSKILRPSVDLHLHTAVAKRAPGLSQGQRNLSDAAPKTLKPVGGQNYLYRTSAYCIQINTDMLAANVVFYYNL